MPNAFKIKQTMIEQGIPDNIIAQFDFPDPKGNLPEPMINFINRMDELLTHEQCLAIMQEQGCSKTGKMGAGSRAFSREFKHLSLEEKIQLYVTSETYNPYRLPCQLNGDNTLSVFWGWKNNDQYQCVCACIKKLKPPVNISKTYCGCCAGHARHHLQTALGIRLRLKEIVSTPLNSDGKDQCEFLFEIM